MAGPGNRALVAWILVGVIGWAGLIWIGVQLDAASSDQVGFDLELLLDGARAISAGASPYDPGMLAGTSPAAPSLFYSYPPLVAQALVPLTGLPSRLVLVMWDAAAVFGLGLVAEGLRRRLAPQVPPRAVVVPMLACVPLVLPFAIGLLFGNLDVFFPMLYGAMLLAVIGSGSGTRISAGVALLVALLKLHPGSMMAWFVARAASRPRQTSMLVVVAAALVGGAIAVIASLALWGAAPWQEYRQVVEAGAGAEIIDRRNAGVAVQLAMLTGGDEGFARVAHLGVGVVAIALTIWAALRRSDPLESFAWAAVASLSTLPVTWYHYLSALIPIAIAALLRDLGGGSIRGTWRLVLVAGIVAGVAIAWLPLVWVATALVIAAARSSGGVTPQRATLPLQASGPDRNPVSA